MAITIGLNALDGFDVLSISFASPGITAEWDIDRGAARLRAVGRARRHGARLDLPRRRRGQDRPAADDARLPRRDGARHVHGHDDRPRRRAYGLATVAVARGASITGLGIGGMLAAINAVAAEFSNAKRQALERLDHVDRLSGRCGAVGGFITSWLLQRSRLALRVLLRLRDHASCSSRSCSSSCPSPCIGSRASSRTVRSRRSIAR